MLRPGGFSMTFAGESDLQQLAYLPKVTLNSFQGLLRCIQNPILADLPVLGKFQTNIPLRVTPDNTDMFRAIDVEDSEVLEGNQAYLHALRIEKGVAGCYAQGGADWRIQAFGTGCKKHRR